MKTTTWTIGTIKVTSYGNGTAYSIEEFDRFGTVRSLFLQGDDASQFQDEINAAPDQGAYLVDTLDNHCTPETEG